MYCRYKIVLLLFVLIFMGVPSAYSLPWSYDMWEQPAIQPYEHPMEYPEGSVTVDGKVLASEKREDLEQIVKSPIPTTKESVANGKVLFGKHCVICHGEDGKGMGVIIKKGHGFYPLDLTSPGVRQRTDGYLYAYILYGGKVMMPSYLESIPDSKDAWDIVNYIRFLQKKTTNTAKERD